MSDGAMARPAALAILAAVLAVAELRAAKAEDWPSRPVTLVVPYAPGGNIDQAARVFGQELSRKLGQQFIVESKGGAGGSLGAAAVAKSKPDGYTLLVTANGPAVLNKMLYASLPYDPDTDFTPISLISDVPQAFIVNPKSPVRDLKEFIERAKQKPDGVTIGHPGIGTGAHLATLLLSDLAGFKVVPVAYRGANPIVMATLGGEIEAGFPAYIPQVQSTKTLAVSTAERVSFLPDVPTFRESNISLIAGTFTGLVAPTGTPPEIVTKLNRMLDDFLKTEPAQKALAALGARALGGPPERLTERMNQEKTAWGPIIQRANIRLQ
jgi:tripartite-type tricarboxylate transporter receptor subunit TctC